MNPFDFKNKVVLITGGGGGLGKATAQAFLNHQARVVCVDLRPPESPLAGCQYDEVDVSNFEQVAASIERIIERHGRLDCLINNAGISQDAPVWRMTEGQWDAVLEVNLKGSFNFIHHVAPYFRKQNSGKIVNVSSINGMRGKFGLVNYAASKAGLIGLTKTIAKELGRHQVNVNAVAPGYILTPLTEKLPEKVIDAARRETVFERLGKPEDVANTIIFLCSELARHITGEVIKIDGGQYI